MNVKNDVTVGVAKFLPERASSKKEEKDTTEEYRIAMRIYGRISRGAKVSVSDERFLRDYSAKLYMLAKNAQMTAERQEDCSKDSLSERYEKRKEERERKAAQTAIEEDNRLPSWLKGAGSAAMDRQSPAETVLGAGEFSAATETSDSAGKFRLDLTV